MSDPDDERQSYPLKTPIVAGFLLAALATYIPIAALGAYILVDLRVNPQPPPALGGIGAALCFFIVGPLCSLVAGVVGAYLAGYRQVDLRWMVFCLLVGVSLAIAAIMGGRASVRRVLYMAALSARRYNPAIRSFAERLTAQGKRPKVVITACMRKLLVILNTILKNNTPWTDSYAH